MQCVANYVLESWAGQSRGFTKSNKDHVSDYLIILYIQGSRVCMYYRVIGLYGVEIHTVTIRIRYYIGVI